MKSVIPLFSKIQPKTFKVSYAPEYKSFTFPYIAADSTHPLSTLQKRRQKERAREGLWWHVTTGLDLSKSSCVRSWARRRLRNAVGDELKQRGYDNLGRLVDLTALEHRSDLANALRQGKTLELTGSMRLHIQPPLVNAKYTDIRTEIGQIIEAMLQFAKGGTNSSQRYKSRS